MHRYLDQPKMPSGASGFIFPRLSKSIFVRKVLRTMFQIDFFKEGPNRQTFISLRASTKSYLACKKTCTEHMNILVPHIRIPLGPECQKLLCFPVRLKLFFSAVTTACITSIKVQINFLCVQVNSCELLPVLLLAEESR